MPDSTPSTTGPVVRRLGALTWISLGLNGLFVLLILIGIIRHPHHPRHEDRFGGPMGHHVWADRDGDGGFPHDDFGPMHHGWHREGFGGPGCACGMEGPHHGFGMEEHPGWGGDRPGFGGPPMDDHFMPRTPPSAEEMTDRFMLMLAERLSLTDQESAQIRPIVQGGIEQFQKDMEAQKQAHQKMLDDDKTKVRALLTPDQQKEFDGLTAGFGGPPDPAVK